MELLTKEIIKKTPLLYGQENVKSSDKMVYARFFAPWGNWTWYLTEMDKDQNECFGYVVGFDNEWGYFDLNELKEIRGVAGLKIERDIYFKPCKFSEIKEL